ncbi:65-kDa microtubule-associated protein 3 isoform X1 [Aegilops tauschii subsp. strangulata]|nr:65-kDa microtubule-associated protein 3 [Aegilops tauschii subsp. strangulata]
MSGGDQLLQMETACGALMRELQVIWDEIGEQGAARDTMLLQLQQECLDAYRRKVDQASRCRAQLRQAIADAQAELAAVCSAMAESPALVRQKGCGLREELSAIVPYLEEMKKRKVERWNQILDVIGKIKKISSEIRPADFVPFKAPVDQSDLSCRRLEELRMELQSLEKEKSERLKQVMDYLNTLHSLCKVLAVDFKQTISDVHPSLDEDGVPMNISNTTIERLALAIQRLRETKIERMQKLQDLSSTMLELWNLMDTPIEEQQSFQNITCNIAASEPEITEANALSIDVMNFVEAEVLRLEQLKVSKMKDLVLKKQTELEEHRRRAHLVGDEHYATQFNIEAIEAGAIDPSLLLEQIEAYIATVKEDAFSRKDILERVERWLNACEEEAWLEDYSKDDNRYNAGRGAHIMLKRAEKARVLVNKIPGIVDVLTNKVIAWEKERGTEFTYDGVSLLSMLDDYRIVREEKEQEKKRQRDQKKLEDQFKAEQELLYGSKPSPSSRSNSGKKLTRNPSAGTNRRLSVGGGPVRTPKSLTPQSRSVRSAKKTEDSGTLSPGSRGKGTASPPIKKLSFKASTLGETETPRKPFTQITPGNSIQSTPVRSASNGTEGENRTPKILAAPSPRTPMTVTSPMQMTTTPALTAARAAPVCVSNDKPELCLLESTEYSFEERRLAYLAAHAA